MYLLHRSVGPSVQFLYSGCMIAAKFRIMTIEQRAVRGTAENFVICDTQMSYSENLFRRLSEKLSGYFQFHVFHDIENLKIAAKSMQVNILLIGEEYGKEDRDEIPARQKYLLIGEKIPNERSPTEIPFFRYQSVSSMLELLLQEKDQENPEVQTHQIQLVSDRSQTVKANVNGLIGIYSPVHRIGKTRFAMRMGRVLSESIPTLYLNLEGYSGLNYYLPEESGMNLGDLLYYMKQESINPVWKISTLISHMNGVDYIAPIRAEQDFREVTKEEWNQLLDLILEKPVKEMRAFGILLLGGVMIVFQFTAEKQKQKEQRKKEIRQMQFDYPQLINKFSLYIGAGMTVRRAWIQIVKEYDKEKHYLGERTVYEEMRYTMNELKNGRPESECYEAFGRRCESPVYRKFGMLLSQNLRKGTKGLTNLLQREAQEAFEERKNMAKKLGEEAGTKLMIPLFLMLAVVFVIVTVPAFLTIQI